MKRLKLSRDYELLLEGFSLWLDVLGYSSRSVSSLPVHVRELLHYLLCEGIEEIEDMDGSVVDDFVCVLKCRENINYGGVLSNSMINKVIYSLGIFCRYLSVSRGHYVSLELDRMEMSCVVPVLLSKEEIGGL